MKIKRKFIYLAILVAILLYANCFTTSFKFSLIYSPYNDAGELYSVQSIFDNTLFKNDPVLTVIKNHMNVVSKIREFAHNAIYYLLMHFFSFPLAIKIVSIIFAILCTLLVYKIGACLYSKDYAYLLSSLFLFYFLSMDTFYSGQDRCFGIFTFLVFLLFLVKEKFYFLPFFLPLVIFIYQPLLYVFTTVCLLIPFLYRKNIKLSWYILFLAISILIGLLFIFNDKLLNTIITNIPLLRSYKYYCGNNIVNPLNPWHFLLYFVLNLNEHSRLYVYFTYFFIAVSLIIVILKRKKAFSLPKAIWLIFLGSFFSFLIIYPANPILASRQLVFSLPLFLVFFVSTNISGIIIKSKIKSAILLSFLISVFVLLHPIFGEVHDYKEYKPVYGYIESLPKDVFIAGYPGSLVMDKIPFFSKRTVFFSDYMDDLLYLTYGAEGFRERRQNLISALYADSIEEVKFFITKYKIDYLIIETSYYNDSLFDHLKQSVVPYGRQTWSIIKTKIETKNFTLLDFVKEYHDFELKNAGGDIFIISAKKILNK